MASERIACRLTGAVNHKKIQRLWRDEGLRVPQRRRRKRVGSSTIDAPAAVAPNAVWAVDFQFDSDERGSFEVDPEVRTGGWFVRLPV